MITAEMVRTLLIVGMVGMALLAVLYLRQRRLSWLGYCGWGLLALLVPVLGPFLVVANRPGDWDPSVSFAVDVRRIGALIQRLLPTEPPRGKLTPADQVRRRRDIRVRK